MQLPGRGLPELRQAHDQIYAVRRPPLMPTYEKLTSSFKDTDRYNNRETVKEE